MPIILPYLLFGSNGPADTSMTAFLGAFSSLDEAAAQLEALKPSLAWAEIVVVHDYAPEVVSRWAAAGG